ncbi:uncharacterized protein BcabD6B2_39530 [Babesia caballi]|uniref:Variant erythrocyte surface antigen-1, beta subunit n=1 Tax=Babesia caballi TaxID=5871 RepID=A0AAV4LXP1_BABCB|nr:hypothetical protein, conserved [Babesia caballi]
MCGGRTPIITGGGILPANVAKHQVCNAVLNFVIRFLEGLCGINLPNSNTYKPSVNTVIGTLRKCFGTGKVPGGFQQLVDAIKGKVELGFDKKINASGGKTKTSTIFTELYNLVTTRLSSYIGNENNVSDSSAVTSYITEIAEKLKPDGSNTLSDLFNQLTTLFSELKNKPSTLKDNELLDLNKHNLDTKVTSVITAANNPDLNSDIRRSRTDKPFTSAVFTAVRGAAAAFIAEPQTKKHTSYYDKADWNSVSGDDDKTKCAKIFLGCLPLFYQALTYIYWGCHEKGGGWRNQTHANGSMKSYFDSQGLMSPYVDTNKRGAHIADSALKGFSEFQQGMTNASSPPLSSATFPYVKFTEALRGLLNTEQQTSLPSKCPLSALFYGASCYFRYQQMTKAQSAVSAPKTIREMLYFLAALQFSSAYDEIDGYIGTVLNPSMNVADSSKPPSGGNDTLSSDQLKEYLRASCALSSSVLGVIQGPGASQSRSDPWLHELYCNTQFNLSYSSGQAIFNVLANCTYALQFQLSFLFSMCANNVDKCGWQHCTYGSEINGSGNPSLTSHICPGLKCSSPGRCNHKSSLCNHNKYTESGGCGQSGSPSPLQAFITGALPSFNLSSSSTPNHMSDHPQGALCHVPMGFQANHLRSIGNGAVVYLVLKPICGNFSSPLRQLCEKLGCLTKRTPRSLGDMFGFNGI